MSDSKFVNITIKRQYLEPDVLDRSAEPESHVYRIKKSATVKDLKFLIFTGDRENGGVNGPGPGPSQFMLYQFRAGQDGNTIFVAKNKDSLASTYCRDPDPSTWEIYILIFQRKY